MIFSVIIFSLASVFVGGVLFGLSYVPGTPVWLLPAAIGSVSWGAGWLGIIFATQERLIRSITDDRNSLLAQIKAGE